MTENFVFGKVTVIFWYCDIHRNHENREFLHKCYIFSSIKWVVNHFNNIKRFFFEELILRWNLIMLLINKSRQNNHYKYWSLLRIFYYLKENAYLLITWTIFFGWQKISNSKCTFIFNVVTWTLFIWPYFLLALSFPTKFINNRVSLENWIASIMLLVVRIMNIVKVSLLLYR